jgi:thiamine-monophosphate kinase
MEQEFIRWLQEHVLKSHCAQNQRHSVLLGIGDDGAVVLAGEGKRVQVADAIVDQVHFDLGTHELTAIGRKALAINLSDIAAMGAIAETALVTTVLPRSMSFEDAKELFCGIAELASQYDVAIVGGDTVRHDGPLMINVAATGWLDPAFKSPQGWRMNGACVGDLLVVTGPLGGSFSGHHLNFFPRLDVAKAIQDRVPISAATDISDSFSIDLGHLIRQSGVGAVLECDTIPLTESAFEMSQGSHINAVDHALQDGEDFELLLSISRENLTTLENDVSFEISLIPIGVVVEEHAGRIVDGQSGETIDPKGYQH